MSEDESCKEAISQSSNGSSNIKVEHTRLALPSNAKGYNMSKPRHSSSSISPLKSIPEATGNGASEIEVVDHADTLRVSTSHDTSIKDSIKSDDSISTPSMSLLAVTVPKGPAARSASLQPPQETEDETEISLFNRRQSGKLI